MFEMRGKTTTRSAYVPVDFAQEQEAPPSFAKRNDRWNFWLEAINFQAMAEKDGIDCARQIFGDVFQC